ncbi:MAG: urea carboxylase-associated family protein [Gemmatimonadaceae bacterium]|nr:urea carboxylase-associated family protein [Gemmatimonadaceae bacterium]
MSPPVRVRIPRQAGVAFEIFAGQRLKVIDPLGQQVSDMVSFSKADLREHLSSGRTIDYANTIYLSTGHTLYSNRSTPMWTIMEDRVGRHDFLLTPCSPETFKIIYNDQKYHPSCFENLSLHLAGYGVLPDMIPTTMNIFMNVEVGSSGELSILAPRSKPEDYILLRAEMDMVVGVTACSAELSNNGSFKPIDIEILGQAD